MSVEQKTAARRIVAIHQSLFDRMTPEKRQKLTAEQKRLWSRAFPGEGFEQVARAAA